MLFFSASFASANLITNGGFETGNLAGWDIGGTPLVDAPSAHSGNFGVTLGGGGSFGRLSQLLTLAPNSFYDLTFSISVSGLPGDWSHFGMDWNGGNPRFEIDNHNSFDWVQITLRGLPSGSDGLAELYFYGVGEQKFHLDDFTLTLGSAVPESLPFWAFSPVFAFLLYAKKSLRS